MDFIFCHLESIYKIALIVGAAVGIGLAVWRCRTADKNLLQERFKIGSELMDMDKHHYSVRVSGAVILAELARKYPKTYEIPVMTTFEAFLEYPPCFSKHMAQNMYGYGMTDRLIDYGSRDTIFIINAIHNRTRKQRAIYKTFHLSPLSPFYVDPQGRICASEYDPSYQSWINERGSPPTLT